MRAAAADLLPRPGEYRLGEMAVLLGFGAASTWKRKRLVCSLVSAGRLATRAVGSVTYYRIVR